MPRGEHNGHARGSSHPRWNGGRLLSSQGYVLIRVGKGHPLANPNGYVYEHTLVMVAALGRKLKPGELVHHRNDDKQDNRFENLELTTRPEHNRHHNQARRRDGQGRFAKAVA